MASGVEPENEDDERGRDARAIARRHRAAAGKPLSPVMKTAVTASALAHGARRAGDRKG